ncbi:MAG: hypothetical protein IKA43_06025, partial [Clostridia bacterium]|nr:hypothetical protein [Clostridia bacterium]
MLTKLKLKDNVNDTHGFKRLLAKIVALVSVFFKKTDKNLTSLEALLKEKIDALSALEAQECDSVDSVSSIFGELLGVVASYGLDGEIATLCTKIGYHLGKWIYVIDAIDDIEDDAKSHSFNPIINAFGATPTDEDKDILRLSLMLELDEMSKSVEALDFSAHRDVEGIIKNTIYVGMVNQVNRVLKLKTV